MRAPDGTTYSDSGYSTSKNALTIPGVPSNVHCTAQNTNSITVAWDAPVGGATSYKLEWSADGVNSWTQIGSTLTATSYTHSSLTAETRYYYRVTAVNTTGVSAVSTNFSTLTHNFISLAAPILGAVSATSDSTISVHWTTVANASGYTVQYSTDSGFTTFQTQTVSGGTTATVDITGLNANTRYYVRILTKGDEITYSDSGSSTIVSATTAVQPEIPANLRTTSTGKTALQLEWNKVADTTEYVLQRQGPGDSDFVTIYTGADAKFTDTNRAVDTTYQYQVQATNGRVERRVSLPK